ncbi:hypothetical protein GYMLUDRAFT_260462 [Collybiopsis luxurians FD-317 M1]|uniref:Hypervirulence associated protein TUDOR domain-containing protein n=1 Tax=Collybiopsis luxurians FD-317 M1 TaxID=944289 RepID=A0A0D0CZC7_9AGAR|nr:hypothetical protein GYMLUDRAFT_260462 [Collybiopsis luxurians FD-317 M1]
MTKQTSADDTNATYEIGDHVQYQAVGGGNVPNSTTQGEVTEVITDKESADKSGVRNTGNASSDDPRYVIRNDKTGKETAYKEKNIEGTTE